MSNGRVCSLAASMKQRFRAVFFRPQANSAKRFMAKGFQKTAYRKAVQLQTWLHIAALWCCLHQTGGRRALISRRSRTGDLSHPKRNEMVRQFKILFIVKTYRYRPCPQASFNDARHGAAVICPRNIHAGVSGNIASDTSSRFPDTLRILS